MQETTDSRFDRGEVAKLLAQCHRRCCICHRFCGFKMETDHIVPAGDGGTGEIDNAIPVCFECHAEIHCYNDKHPRGRKYTANELRAHKEQWLGICCNNPAALIQAPHDSGVGPLNSLIDELEYNQQASTRQNAIMNTVQFEEAIRSGAVSALPQELKDCIYAAYAEISAANHSASSFLSATDKDIQGRVSKYLTRATRGRTKAMIADAQKKLLVFLSSR